MNEVSEKLYRAMFWPEDPNAPGRRISVLATSIVEAKEKLEAEYGTGRIFDLHNESEAARVR